VYGHLADSLERARTALDAYIGKKAADASAQGGHGT
jgi:hypothetical protein